MLDSRAASRRSARSTAGRIDDIDRQVLFLHSAEVP